MGLDCEGLVNTQAVAAENDRGEGTTDRLAGLPFLQIGFYLKCSRVSMHIDEENL
jgi:hypothetical protein